MRSRLAMWAVALWAASCATGSNRREEPEVKGLSIEGVRELSEQQLKEKILTAESSWLPGWVPGLGRVSYFDPNVWQADLRRIERYYQANGYYQAKVLQDLVDHSEPGAVRLKVRVEEGPPTHVSRVEVQGLSELPPLHQQRVLEEVPFKAGQVFREESWVGLRVKLEQALRELGYVEATVEGEVLVDVATQEARVQLLAQPGPRYRFGKVIVASQPKAKVSAKAIIEQVNEEVGNGRWYSESALASAQARVFQMGVFGAVKVNRGAPDRAQGTVPVVVDVREAPFTTERRGAGLGVDQTRQSLHGVWEYTHRNFLGDLRRLTVRGTAGYAVLPNVLALAQQQPGTTHGLWFKGLSEFEQPRFLRPDMSLQTSLEVSRGLQPAYDFIGGSYRLGLPIRPHKAVTIVPSYNFDLYWLSTQVPLDGRSPTVTFGCPLTCALSYLEQTIEWDRRDNRLEPRRGYYLALSLQEGGGPLQGAFTYLKIQPDLRGYLSFGPESRWTLGAKLKAGTILAPEGENTPIISRFFSGGGGAMRGFNTRRLSPLMAVSTGGPTGETVPVGGNGLFESSAELRYNLAGEVVLAAFVDAGFVTSSSFQLPSPSYLADHMLYAVGLGLRYRTPFGPIRVDLAHRLPFGPPLEIVQSGNHPVAIPVDRSCFGLGNFGGTSGSPEGVCSFHLSIGEAF